MNSKESSIQKMCSFYVSDWHFSTMMLPYISKLLEEDTQIETMLEPEMEEKMKTLISKLNINPETKKKVLNIHWHTINQPIKKLKGESTNKPKVIIINGTKKKIDRINDILEEEMNLEDKKTTTIINCYPATKIEENMQEILAQYDYMINTSGQHKIKEIFPERKDA